MPSMRALWAAGDAARADNTTMYNCSFRNVDSVEAFAEALYILMCGTGFGFRVTFDEVAKLPTVPSEIMPSMDSFSVADSKEGWADSVKFLMNALYAGRDPQILYDKIRPAGARLKTMGGRASGPAPLIRLHQFVRDTFYQARGRKLSTLEAHDIMCQIAEIVVVGGVRRSSEISLSSLSDELLRHAKTGNFPVKRWMANNSAVYEKKPSAIEFLAEWSALAASGRGERGIFNLESARKMAPKRRKADLIEGTNPCGEIQLRNMEFCNLSEVVVRPDDDLDSLLDKVETATWLGVIQSTFTYFPYLNPKWKENCEEERLLGVSITGQMDAPHLLTEEALKAMKARAIKVAKRASEVMGINMPAAITCTKPSGTVSQIAVCGAGLHRWRGKYMIRRYRINATDPLFNMLREQGVKLSPENGQRQKDWKEAQKIFKETAEAVSEEAGLKLAREKCPAFDPAQEWDESKVNTWVISFPVKAPATAKTLENATAIEQLEWYKKIQTNWCEHNASITVNVKDHEWFEVGNWVYSNWDIVNGISFLPEDPYYEQLPEEAIDKETYDQMVSKLKKIDYSQLPKYELEDATSGSKEYACTANGCALP
jgi:ribonucleoside-diphosphate reductase alpha chain